MTAGTLAPQSPEPASRTCFPSSWKAAKGGRRALPLRYSLGYRVRSVAFAINLVPEDFPPNGGAPCLEVGEYAYTTDTREKPMSRLTFTRHSDALIGAHLPASEEQPRRPCLRTTSRSLARQALRVAQNRASCPSPSLHAHCQRRHRPRDTRVHIQAKLLIAVTLMKSDTVIHHVGDEARPATRQAP